MNGRWQAATAHGITVTVLTGTSDSRGPIDFYQTLRLTACHSESVLGGIIFFRPQEPTQQVAEVRFTLVRDANIQ